MKKTTMTDILRKVCNDAKAEKAARIAAKAKADDINNTANASTEAEAADAFATVNPDRVKAFRRVFLSAIRHRLSTAPTGQRVLQIPLTEMMRKITHVCGEQGRPYSVAQVTDAFHPLATKAVIDGVALSWKVQDGTNKDAFGNIRPKGIYLDFRLPSA